MLRKHYNLCITLFFISFFNSSLIWLCLFSQGSIVLFSLIFYDSFPSLLYSSLSWYCMYLCRQIQIIFETICGINKKQTVCMYTGNNGEAWVKEKCLLRLRHRAAERFNVFFFPHLLSQTLLTPAIVLEWVKTS